MSDANLAKLVVSLEAKIDGYQKSLDKARRATYGAANDIQKSLQTADDRWGKLFGHAEPAKALDNVFSRARFNLIDEGGKRIAIFGSAIEDLGAFGIAAAAGIAAVALAAEQAKKSMEWADDIKRTADSLGVTTDSLQSFDYAAVASSIGVEKGRQALADFNQELGKFETHTSDTRLKKWAEAIGLDRASINAMIDPTDKLATVMERIATLGDAQSRASAAEAFGLRELLPVINGGKQAIEDFTTKMGEAQKLGGVVSSDDIKRAAELNDKVEALSYLIGQNFKQAFIDLAPAIEKVAEYMERLSKAVADFTGEIPDAVRGAADLAHMKPGHASPSSGSLPGPVGAVQGTMNLLSPQTLLEVGWKYLTQRGQTAKLRDQMQAFMSGKMDVSGAMADIAAANQQGAGHQVTFDKKKTDESQKAIQQATKDELAARLALTKDLDQEHEIRLELLDAEAKAKISALDKQLQDGKISKAAHDQAVAAESAAAIERKELENRTYQLAVEKQLLDASKAYNDLMDRQLAAQAEITPSAKQRAELELTIFRYKQQQALLEYQYNEKLKVATGAIDQKTAATNVADFKATQASEYAAEFQKQLFNADPIAAYSHSLQDLDNIFRNDAVDAMKSLSDGLADAIVNAKSLGDVVKSVFRQLITQIISTMLQKEMAQSAAALFAIPGFAGGTDSAPGGLTLVGERGPELLNIPRGSQIVPNGGLANAVRGGGQTVIVQNFHLDGAVTTGDLLDRVRVEGAKQITSAVSASQTSTMKLLRQNARNRLGR